MKRLLLTGRILGLCAILNLTAGCGVEIAMIGVAASAASTGSAVYKQGKLNASWMAPFDRVVMAGEAAFIDMGMSIKKSKGDSEKGDWTIVAVNDENEKIILTIDRKSPSLTEFQIDMGWFGREATARLLLKRMAVAINLGVMQDGTQ